MDCESFRRMICEDCSQSSEPLDAHEAECRSCAAFARRARTSEALLQRALRFDVGAARSHIRRGSARADSKTSVWAGLAAALVAALSIQYLFIARNPIDNQAFAVQVLEHWDHEPSSWRVSSSAVPEGVLRRALDGKASVDLTRVGPVTYARSCRVAGQWMPHLVVQTAHGPVMVLLVPERQVDQTLPLGLPDRDIGGTVSPHGGGSIVVIGTDSIPFEAVEENIAAAIEWTI